MRYPQEMFAEKVAWMFNYTGRPVPVINAGSGKDQHPTQALLDIYTLHRSFENYGGIDGKSVAFVGDLLRGRTVRSLSYLLKNYDGVKIYYASPKVLRMAHDLKDFLGENKIFFEEYDDINHVIPKADAVYMTRIQDEYDVAAESSQIEYTKFHFKKEHLKMLKPNAIIMHPLPRRAEIAPEVDSDPRAMYWRQVRNGMWVRVALISTIMEKNEDIMAY
jgi:aspartate carbamoyltransferase catalytic subunit